MADVKDEYSLELVAALAGELHRAWPALPVTRFEAEAASGLGPLALMQRVRHIAATLARALPADFTKAAAVIDRALVDDPSGYVRRSVADHLNDIAKDHPDLALGCARRWLATGSDRAAWSSSTAYVPWSNVATQPRWPCSASTTPRRSGSTG